MRNNNKSKVLIGMLCLSIGVATILSLVLPGWIWSTLTALILIGCGALLFFC
ncbi:2-oxoglutarate translocator [Clostridioides mangenotii]|uniref:2-oxoglutarate translocator n=1 Tax=Metaclostridioides mangenotii TaxID=1540 RepID=UPI001C108ED9|nr:2-oxoglutarate translocator [Clostridioides mangenotii]MBU5306670.1 2-oxoglutarate translocator [Clostridioides mangenotii]MCR1953542.1 2-oxoglutarate translocator [Clostridioides mangenotii]